LSLPSSSLLSCSRFLYFFFLGLGFRSVVKHMFTLFCLHSLSLSLPLLQQKAEKINKLMNAISKCSAS
jgi:hypothetical protein